MYWNRSRGFDLRKRLSLVAEDSPSKHFIAQRISIGRRKSTLEIFKSARTENKNDILAVRARGRPMSGEKKTHLQQPLREAWAIQECNFGIQVRLEQSVVLLSCSPRFSAPQFLLKKVFKNCQGRSILHCSLFIWAVVVIPTWLSEEKQNKLTTKVSSKPIFALRVVDRPWREETFS